MAAITTTELSDWDRRLLDRYLSFYRDLDNGFRAPSTSAQQRFRMVCSGKAKPRSQHEVAYARLKALEARGMAPYGPTRTGSAYAKPMALASQSARERSGSVLRIADAADVVDAIEAAEYSDRKPNHEALFDRLKDLYRQGRVKSVSISADAALWVSTLLADRSLSADLTAWLTGRYGDSSTVYTKAIDGSWVEKGMRAGHDYISPWLHRLFEGHSVAEAWERVQAALPDDTLLQELHGFATAMWSDLVTPAGLPLFSLGSDQYNRIREVVCDQLGVPTTWLNDALSIDASELVSGIVPIIPLVLGWNADDAGRYAKLVGGLGVGTIVAANPITALVALVMIARGLQKTCGGEGQVIWALGIAKGGATTGAILATSALIGGPAWIGLVAGTALGVWLARRTEKVTLDDVQSFLRTKLSPLAAPAS